MCVSGFIGAKENEIRIDRVAAPRAGGHTTHVDMYAYAMPKYIGRGGTWTVGQPVATYYTAGVEMMSRGGGSRLAYARGRSTALSPRFSWERGLGTWPFCLGVRRVCACDSL